MPPPRSGPPTPELSSSPETSRHSATACSASPPTPTSAAASAATRAFSRRAASTPKPKPPSSRRHSRRFCSRRPSAHESGRWSPPRKAEQPHEDQCCHVGTAIRCTGAGQFMGTSVVFGGSGFIGTHLLRTLAASSGDQVISADIRDPKNAVPGVDYRRADVRDLCDFTVSGSISTLYNLAAVHTTPGHPDHEYYETNVLGASEVTAFARRMGVKEIVFTSSISVYGPGEETKSETSPLAPVSPYGRSKM